MKTVTYFDYRIEKLKAQIKRLTAERRLAILRQREKQITANTRQGAGNG